MPVTEQQLRERLTAAARRAAPPGFTVENVAATIRRRRARRTVAVSACAAVVVALAVALPVGLTGGRASAPHGSLGGAAGAPEAPREPRFTTTVNGRHPSWLRSPASGDPVAGCGSVAHPCPGRIPGFKVTPGERLTFTVTVAFPARARITGLWIGFASVIAPTRTGPIGMSPVFVHTQNALRPRPRTYRFSWTVPRQLPPGTRQQLVATWTGSLPQIGPSGTPEPLVQEAGGTTVTTLAVMQ
jgi:hypothetical protein